MRAAIINQWGKPDIFRIKEIALPEPDNDQLLIKVFASGINPVDWKHRLGNHKYILGSPFPIVLGYDVCGEVVKTGKEVTNFKPGEVVFGDLDNKYGGALGEFAIGRAHCFALKPPNISSSEAAGAPLAALTALQALRDKGNLQAGQTVIINGASGGVGHLALQIAKILGAKTIAVSSSKSRAFVEQFNPDFYIDYTQEKLLTSSIKADIFFDVAGKLSFVKARHLLHPGGCYINTLPRPKILIHKVLQIFSQDKKVKTLLRRHSAQDMKIIADWIEGGQLKVHIDKVFPLIDIAKAHAYSEKGHSKGKNIVSIQSS